MSKDLTDQGMAKLIGAAVDADGREFALGYNAALNDCIGLLRKWFFGTNKDARACEADMRKLSKR